MSRIRIRNSAVMSGQVSASHLHPLIEPVCRAYTMVPILDGNSHVSAHLRSNPCYLICLRPLIRSRAVTLWIFFYPEKKPIILHACATCS